jgi:hypothetical protein
MSTPLHDDNESSNYDNTMIENEYKVLYDLSKSFKPIQPGEIKGGSDFGVVHKPRPVGRPRKHPSPLPPHLKELGPQSSTSKHHEKEFYIISDPVTMSNQLDSFDPLEVDLFSYSSNSDQSESLEIKKMDGDNEFNSEANFISRPINTIEDLNLFSFEDLCSIVESFNSKSLNEIMIDSVENEMEINDELDLQNTSAAKCFDYDYTTHVIVKKRKGCQFTEISELVEI